MLKPKLGVFAVKGVVWNPQNPLKKVEVDMLVDTGSTYTVLPENLLRSLAVTPLRTAKLRLADGRLIERPLGEVGVELEGLRATATPVVFGEGEVALLGSVTLEQLGLAPDPVAKRLKSVEALLM
jgi:predicted aspartyl protease